MDRKNRFVISRKAKELRTIHSLLNAGSRHLTFQVVCAHSRKSKRYGAALMGVAKSANQPQ